MTDSNIEDLIIKISNDLERLESIIEQNNIKKVSIQFPRGFIRTAKYFREKYGFVFKRPLLDNIAYCLQVTDVFRWIFNRFDLDLTAKEMLIKQGIVCISSVVEAMCWYIVKVYLKQVPNKRFSKNLEKLKKKNILSDTLLEEIEKLKERRDCIHLYRLTHKEINKYTLKDYNKGIEIILKIKDEIESYLKRI